MDRIHFDIEEEQEQVWNLNDVCGIIACVILSWFLVFGLAYGCMKVFWWVVA